MRLTRRGGRVVDCGGLENRWAFTGLGGSNPPSSAITLGVNVPSTQNKLDRWKLNAYKVWTLIGAGIVFLALLHICGIIWQAVAIVVVAALIVFLTHGIVNRLQQWGVPRAAGSAITLIGLLIIIIGAFALFIPNLAQQVGQLINSLPGYIRDLRDLIMTYASSDGALITVSQLNELYSEAQNWLTSQAATLASRAASGALGIGVGVGNFLLITFISLLASLWVLIDLPKISKEFMNLFDEERQEMISVIGNAFGNAIYGWSKATIVCALLKGALICIIYTIAGVPYASILGVLCGILYIIPYIGPLIGYVLSGALALTVSVPMCVIAVIINVVVQELVAQLISPRLMKSSVNVHPAIILVILIVGEALGGIVGMLAAIPVMAAVQSLFVTFFEAKTGKTLYSEDGALFHKDKEVKLKEVAHNAGDTLTNLKIPKGKH